MLGLELLQVNHVPPVLGCLLVLGKVAVVLVLDRLRFRFEWFLLSLREALPILSDKLGNLGERQVPALQLVPHLCAHHVKISASLGIEISRDTSRDSDGSATDWLGDLLLEKST